MEIIIFCIVFLSLLMHTCKSLKISLCLINFNTPLLINTKNKYHTIRTIQNSNIKVVDTHIHMTDHSLSWLGTGTSKGGGVVVVVS